MQTHRCLYACRPGAAQVRQHLRAARSGYGYGEGDGEGYGEGEGYGDGYG